MEMVVAVREKRPDSMVYFLGILPRPAEDEEAKPYLVKVNRWIMDAVSRLQNIFERVKLLLVQLKFITRNGPHRELFNEEGITLNQQGALVFKKEVFRLAGFAVNQ